MRTVRIVGSRWDVWNLPENIMSIVSEFLDSPGTSEILIKISDANAALLRNLFPEAEWAIETAAGGEIHVSKRAAPIPVAVAPVDTAAPEEEDRVEVEEEEQEEFTTRPPSTSERFLPGLVIGDPLSTQHLNISLAGRLGVIPNPGAVEAAQTRIASLERDLLIAYRELDRLMRTINQNECVTQIVTHIERLLSGRPANKIEDVLVTQNYIIVTTTPIISAGQEGRRHKIGRLELYIPLAALYRQSNNMPAQWQIRVRNKDARLFNDGTLVAQAPHADGHGRICLGNAAPMLLDAYSKGDLLSIVDTMIRFFESPNLSDVMGINVIRWPEAERV